MARSSNASELFSSVLCFAAPIVSQPEGPFRPETRPIAIVIVKRLKWEGRTGRPARRRHHTSSRNQSKSHFIQSCGHFDMGGMSPAGQRIDSSAYRATVMYSASSYSQPRTARFNHNAAANSNHHSEMFGTEGRLLASCRSDFVGETCLFSKQCWGQMQDWLSSCSL